jgi:mevalonate kinase
MFKVKKMASQSSNSVYNASAPGSLMLFGEHAVLYGQSAIVAALDQRIHVTLNPRNDDKIKIFSANHGTFTSSLSKLIVKPAFKYVLTAIKAKLRKIPSGFDLHITADFASNLGLGSSAAVTVATLAVLDQWLYQRKLDHRRLLLAAREVITAVQGCGSGADVAASVYGGVILYDMHPVRVKPLAASLPLVIIYSGSKTPTPIVIAKVKKAQLKQPKLFSLLFKAIGQCTTEAAQALKKRDFKMLGNLMNEHHALQDALGVSTPVLANLCFALREQSGVYGAKISGSGLGDCVIGLGQLPREIFGDMQLDVTISKQGCDAPEKVLLSTPQIR